MNDSVSSSRTCPSFRDTALLLPSRGIGLLTSLLLLLLRRVFCCFHSSSPTHNCIIQVNITSDLLSTISCLHYQRHCFAIGFLQSQLLCSNPPASCTAEGTATCLNDSPPWMSRTPHQLKTGQQIENSQQIKTSQQRLRVRVRQSPVATGPKVPA